VLFRHDIIQLDIKGLIVALILGRASLTQEVALVINDGII